MVIIFVLMVFFLIQTNLQIRISGQDQTLAKLRTELATLGDLLNLERTRVAKLLLDNEELQAELAGAEENLAAAEATRQALVDAHRAEIEERDESIKASRDEVLQLTASVNALKARLDQLQALVDEKEEEARLAKEATLNLTKQLNDALAGKVLELQDFRSEFFGRLRDVLKDRSDIRIVGDRFVFQSEVLFEQGSADIGEEGQKQLLELSNALREISSTIPTDINWVLQVSGHTDDLPIRTTRYRDNWDLSSARAIAVVRFLVLVGMDPEKLSATGFGEFRPVDPADSQAARARNRRIEFRLTQH
jgi:chemotaxis protein MotB